MSVRVYKIGGPALEDPGLIGPLAAEVRRGEGPVVLVHGGGRAVDRLLKALHIESRFIDGRRETSPEAMAVVEMVLSGAANKELAAKVHALERKVTVHERNIAELADSMAELLATPAPPPKRPIGFINPEDKGKKTQARRKG